MAYSYDVTSSDIATKDFSCTYETSTGVVTARIKVRNPRMDNGTFELAYDTDQNGTFVNGSTFSSPFSASTTFNNEPSWVNLAIKWESYNDIPLQDYGDTDIRLKIFDDDSVLSVTETATINLNLEPNVSKWVEPLDFGKSTTPTFIFVTPTLLRQQKLSPVLTISTSPNFSTGNVTFNSVALEIISQGDIEGFGSAGGGTTDVTIDDASSLSSSDLIAIFDGTSYDSTYTINSATTGTTEEFNITTAYISGTDTQTGLWKHITSVSYTSAITTGHTMNAGASARRKMKITTSGLTASTKYYYKLELNATN